MISPISGNLDFDGFSIILDADADSYINAAVDDNFLVHLNGADLFLFDGDAASPVNGLTFVATATAGRPHILGYGGDSNISVGIRPKGSSGVVILEDHNGNEVLAMAVGTASAVNELTVTNAATGNRPRLSSTGGDTDVGLSLRPKGTTTATIVLEDGNGNEILIAGPATASAVNELTAINAATATRPRLQASGGDTNVSLALRAKGTGGIVLEDGNGNEVLITDAGTASAVNEVTVTNAATANAPRIAPSGGDSNIDLSIRPKGSTGVVRLDDHNGNEVLKMVAGVASAVNEVSVKNAATGNNPELQATGGDTNIGINLVPKGTGVVQVSGNTIAMIKLQSQSASASSNISFALDTWTQFLHFLVIGSHIVPGTDNVDLWLLVSTDGGSTFDNSAAQYGYAGVGESSSGIVSNISASAAQIVMNGATLGTATGEQFSFKLDVFEPGNTGLFPQFYHSAVYRGSATLIEHMDQGSHRLNAQDTTDIRFQMSSGNIASGRFDLYGIY